MPYRLAYGIMFGIVAGMMVYIVVAHLLPGKSSISGILWSFLLNAFFECYLSMA